MRRMRARIDVGRDDRLCDRSDGRKNPSDLIARTDGIWYHEHMITHSFDRHSRAILMPPTPAKRIRCDACIATFSHKIVSYVRERFALRTVGHFDCVNGEDPIWVFDCDGKTIGFYMTRIGASASVGMLEEVSALLDTDRWIVFGSAGSLDRELCDCKIIVPNAAYRDEGTSYHYAPAADEIMISNADVVSAYLSDSGIPYAQGKVWTTDGIYRETESNFRKRKADGCIAVDMECAAMQAACDWKGLRLYYFLFTGDLLDAPEWDARDLQSANHGGRNFDIVLRFATQLK